MSLANLSVNTQPPGPLRGSWLKRRPDSENDDSEDGTSAAKIPRYSWYVTLESESPQPTDEDDESVYSVQDKETDYVADTSDTSTHTWVSSSDTGDLSLHVEYEVASLSEGPNPFHNDESSSDVSDIVAMGVLTFCDSDLGLADDSNDSRSSVDSEIGTADYWTCVQCNAKNNNPLFRYCEKCYQIRKNFFPPRPRWKKSRRQIDSGKLSPHELRTEHVTVQQELTSADSGLGSSQDSKCSLVSDLKSIEITTPVNDTTPMSPLLSSFSPSSSLSKERENITDCEYAIHNKATDVTDGNLQSEFGRSGTLAVNTSYNAGGGRSKREASDLENGSSSYGNSIVDEVNGTCSDPGNKLCITCTAAPKNGAFVHGAVTHICCCYPCAVKVWSKTKRCPICNRKVTNVLKAFYT